MILFKFRLVLLLFLFQTITPAWAGPVEISGELKCWHKISFLFDGPFCSETGSPNPFTDYKLEVIFSKDGKRYRIPGHFAADGRAAWSSASEGNQWRVYFCPDSPGEWTYEVRFTQGSSIAISDSEGESAGYMDGMSGSIVVSPTDKFVPDLRAKGKLRYIGERYLQFAADEEYFLKCGADAPENLLAYVDFDATPNVGGRLKHWQAHEQDYNPDAAPFLWGAQKDKGKSLLGAVSYLAGKGMNAISFLTFNVDGDDRNVFPYLLREQLDAYEEQANEKDNNKLWEMAVMHDRFDVSKLDQWEQLFAYAELKGMFLHFKTQETENDRKMDGGDLGPERRLYYRELISRFGHHLAMNWNLGEENRQTTAQQQDMAAYFSQHDPYVSPIVLHTYPQEHEKVYRPLLGENSELDGISIQTKNADFSLVHEAVKKWLDESAKAGKKWVVAVDEPGDAQHALLPDAEDPEHNMARINGLWGTFLAGGYGTEWYFGYKHPQSDLTCEDWRSRDLFWEQGKIALDFFRENRIPFWEMQGMDELTASDEDFVMVKPKEIYLIYSKTGKPIECRLPKSDFQITWFNPRTGTSANGGRTRSRELKLDCPTQKDWLLYLH